LPNRSLVLAGILAILTFGCSSDSKPPEESLTAASQTPQTAESAGPTATAPISLTPRAGIRADVGTARGLEAEGNIEEAAYTYIALAASPATRSEGTLNAARLLLEMDRPVEVRALLEPFVAGLRPEDGAARYMLARSYTALAMHAEALQQYDLYIQSGRPALPYAHLDRARNLLELARPLEAVTSAQDGLQMGVPPSQRQPFRTMIAQGYERASLREQALAAYQEMLGASDDSFALSRIASIKRDLGDPTAANELIRLIASYPGSALALTEMDDAFARGELIPPVLAGIVYYRQGDYTKAEPNLRQQIAQAANDPASAEAYYYLAAIQESHGEVDAALANYERASATNPDSLIADDALWWRARIQQDRGHHAEAATLYDRISSRYPASTWSPDAAFRPGFISYVNKDFEDAAIIWGALESEGDDERLAFWQAKALLKADDKTSAEPILNQLAAEGEDDFYGIRALSLLAGRHAQPKATRESNVNLDPSFDWSAAEVWLAQKTGRPVSEGAWTADPRWLRAQELWAIGRVGQGDGEVFDLMEANAQDPIAMYTMSRRLLNLGRISMSGRAGQRLLRALDTNPNEGLPKAILSLSYPAAFASLAEKYASAEKISPLLLLAFVRQESFFDPRAESPAGALGLTQLLEDTAKETASKMSLQDFDVSELQHAETNLRIGARYMADQLREFKDEIFVALAAYNAGPGAAQRWRDAEGTDDADVYLETVEFAETRVYVEIVAENYAIYRYLYGGESEPNLP
jgi:soluble lytic murein transglycosylase